MQVKKQFRIWAYALLFVLLWAFFAFLMPEVLQFWEKNQLFRYTSEYWHFFDRESLGLMFYFNTFFVQFNYYVCLGALVYALLFWLIAFLLNKLLARLSGDSFFAYGWIVASLLLPTISCFGLFGVLMVLLILAGTWLWFPIKNTFVRYLCQAVVVSALVWTMREYAVFVCLFYTGLEIRIAHRQGKKIYRSLVWLSWAVALSCLGIGWMIWQPYSFVNFELFFDYIYKPFGEEPPFILFFPTIIMCCCFWSAILLLIGSGFVWVLPIKKAEKISVSFLNLVAGVVIIFVGFGFGYVSSASTRKFQKVDTLCREYRWEEALHELDKEWEKKPIARNTNEYRIFAAQTKISLLATRQATERLFSYPNPMFPMLFPMSLGNQVESYVMPPYYLYAGGFSESLHLNYDFITGGSINVNILRGIIMASLILDDTMPTSKFVHFFENTLFYRREAALYRDVARRNTIPAVVRGKGMLPPKNYAVATYMSDLNAFKQYLNNPDNPFFYEYILAVVLLQKQPTIITTEMSAIKRFYDSGKTPFIAPRYIQEALLANFHYNLSHVVYPRRIEGVSSDTWRDYWNFIKDNQKYQAKKIQFKQLEEKWEHTYWFYEHYVSFVYPEDLHAPIN